MDIGIRFKHASTVVRYAVAMLAFAALAMTASAKTEEAGFARLALSAQAAITPAAVAAALEEAPAADDNAFVTTDRTDYNPGETVVVSGRGFDASESVVLTFVREGVEVSTVTVNANDEGKIINKDFVIGPDDDGASFVVKARGTTSGKTAEAVFTDGTMSYSPTTVSRTVANGGTDSFSIQVRSPSAQSAPCNTNQYPTFKTALTVTPQAISGGTPFTSGFTFTPSPTELTFPNPNTNRNWNIQVAVAASVPAGTYTGRLFATPDTNCHTAGAGTAVTINVTQADNTPPTTSVDSGLYVGNSWTNQNVNVTLTAVDGGSGSGVASLSYSVTGPGQSVPALSVVDATAPFTATIPVTAEGTTMITFLSRDVAGNTEDEQVFYVNIDKTAPTLSVPADITVPADDASGKAVTFTATATDRDPATQDASCTPASGSLFPIGVTTVECSATDAVGNTSTGSFNVTVTKAGQSIDFGALAGKTYGDADFNVSANASSGLTVSFTAVGDCTVTGALVHITGAGSCEITAAQGGNDSYLAATSVSQSFSIAKASSSTVVTCDPLVVTYNGSAFTPCSVAVTGFGGLNLTPDPSYTDNVNAGLATASYSFAGDTNHEASSGSATFTIQKAESNVIVECVPASLVFTGSALTPCTARAEGAGGLNVTLSVTYSNNVHVGTARGDASFGGDDNHTASNGFSEFQITPAPSQVTVTCSPASVVFNNAPFEICTAVATGVGGLNENLEVTYDGNVNVGTATAAATFGGDADHDGSVGSATFQITPAETTTVVTCPASITYTGSALAPCSATVTGPGLDQSVAVDYSNNTNAGMATASATFAAGGNYQGSSDSKQFEILKAGSTTVVSCPASVVYNGSAQTPCTVSVTGANLNLTPAANYTANVNVGDVTASYDFEGDANHTGSADSKTFAITKAPVTATGGSGSSSYDGATKTPSDCVLSGAYLGSLVCSNDPASVGPNAGTTSIAPVVSGAGLSNFEITSVNGSYEITKADTSVTVTFEAGPYTFRGTAFTATAKATGPGGLDENLSVSYSGDCVGVTSANGCTGSASYAGDSNYNPSNGTASITIVKAGSTTVVTCPASVTYNGTAQTPCTVSVTGIGGLNLTPNASYSDNTNAGTATASYDFAGDTNHNASSDSKTFVINPAQVTATAGSGSGYFNYSTQTPSACTVTGTYTGTLSCTNDPASVGPAVGEYTIKPVIADNPNFAITKKDGKYTISKWQLSGFYQPVDMGGVINTVKAGSTVPMKFEIFKTGGTTGESTNTADVKGAFANEVACASISSFSADLEYTATGGTSLRYDTTGGQFIFNWQTPKAGAGKCYAVTMTTWDGVGSITAFFKLK